MCVYIYINKYIYIYIYIYNTRKEPVRFDAFRQCAKENIVSVRFGLAIVFVSSLRLGLRFLNASWFGPVRFRIRLL